MDESDSDAEPAAPRRGATDEDEKYPVDGLFMSEAEKAEIMAMREVEREQILEERTTEIERQRQNRLLRQMVENEERKSVKKKRSADTAELEDGQRKLSRQRTGKAETAMDSLRRARAAKAKRREDNSRGRDYSPGRRDSDGEESDDDFGRARSRTPEKEEEKEAPPPELKDFERVRLGRNEFAQVCFTPGFEAAITGCYIRIALGPHPETGVEQYRMAVIKGTVTPATRRRVDAAQLTQSSPRILQQSAIRAHGASRTLCNRSVRQSSARQGRQGVSFYSCVKW